MSGDANFAMSSTRLTVGGFTQPGVARTLIDIPSNSEKGLSHRFLWTFPRPLYGNFASLSEINQDFSGKIGEQLNIASGITQIQQICCRPNGRSSSWILR